MMDPEKLYLKNMLGYTFLDSGIQQQLVGFEVRQPSDYVQLFSAQYDGMARLVYLPDRKVLAIQKYAENMGFTVHVNCRQLDKLRTLTSNDVCIVSDS